MPLTASMPADPYNPPRVLDIPTVLGRRPIFRTRRRRFNLDGQVVRLEPVLEDPKSTDLFFIMRDATSKTTTYGAGRFLYIELPDHGVNQPRRSLARFQSTGEPPCAFTAYRLFRCLRRRIARRGDSGWEPRYHD